MKALDRSIVTAGQLQVGDWIFEKDGYGFKVLRVVDKGRTVDLYLESDGLLHVTACTLKKTAKVYGFTKAAGK